MATLVHISAVIAIQSGFIQMLRQHFTLSCSHVPVVLLFYCIGSIASLAVVALQRGRSKLEVGFGVLRISFLLLAFWAGCSFSTKIVDGVAGASVAGAARNFW